MKTKHFYLLAVMGLAILSCDKGGNKAPIDEPPAVVPAADENLGTHKIVFEINSDKAVECQSVFSGRSANGGLANLYDGNGNPVPQAWVLDTSANKSKVTCYTDSKAAYLTSSIVISNIEGAATVNLSVKAYVNEKLVKEMTREIKLAGEHVVEVFTFSTAGSEPPAVVPAADENLGTHKIVFEMNSDKDVTYSLLFAGKSANGGPADLYDGFGNPVSQAWPVLDTSTSAKVTCYTDSKATGLQGIISIMHDDDATATCILKAYVNEKLVKEMTREIKLAGERVVEVFTFSTITNTGEDEN